MKMRIFTLLCFILLDGPAFAIDAPATFDDVPTANPTYAGVAISDADAPTAPPPPTAIDAPTAPISDAPTSVPLVSINTNGLDLSWTGAMDLADPMMRPSGIILPFLESYPIDTVEIKMRLLNLKF